MASYQMNVQKYIAGEWLDYGREAIEKPDDAIGWIQRLRRRDGENYRARVEDWSDRNAEPDRYYGQWDLAQLSPAARKNGIFRPDV